MRGVRSIYMKKKQQILKTNCIILGIGVIVVEIFPAFLSLKSSFKDRSVISYLLYPFRFLQSGHASPYLIPFFVAFTISILISMHWARFSWISYVIGSGGMITWTVGMWVDIVAGMIG